MPKHMDNYYTGLEDGGNTARYRTPRKEKPILICAHCAKLISEHQRCKTCEVLLHTDSFVCHCGTAHTLTEDGQECVGCKTYVAFGIPEYDFNGINKLMGNA